MNIAKNLIDNPPAETTPDSARNAAVCRTCLWLWLAVIVSLGLWAVFFALLSLLP